MIEIKVGRALYQIEYNADRHPANYSLWCIRDGRRGRIPEVSTLTIDGICIYITTIEPVTAAEVHALIDEQSAELKASEMMDLGQELASRTQQYPLKDTTTRNIT